MEPGDLESAIGDLITDLLHLAVYQGVGVHGGLLLVRCFVDGASDLTGDEVQ
jgi:hypothetical protein